MRELKLSGGESPGDRGGMELQGHCVNMVWTRGGHYKGGNRRWINNHSGYIDEDVGA